MNTSDKYAREVGAFYDKEESVYFEKTRLEVESLAEGLTTIRALRQVAILPQNDNESTQSSTENKKMICEVGVGTGFYSERLAKAGHDVWLIDVSQKLLDCSVAHMEKSGLKPHNVTLASAMNLDMVETDSCDVVLMLGPLYHLPKLSDRQAAVAEAKRILKPGGYFFAAAINRVAYFRDLLRGFGAPRESVVERREFHKQFLKDGLLTPEMAPIGHAHLSTLKEFEELMKDFDKELLLGTEGFAAGQGPLLAALPQDAIDAYADIIWEIAPTPEGLHVSDHWLFVGRNK